jgi:hypothetical protein
MIEAIKPLSQALGFWVKHQDAMLAFEYEGDDDDSPVPAELQTIFDSYRELLDRIFEVGGDEGNGLVHATANATADAWSSHPNLVIERKRKASEWIETFLVRRKRARNGESMEVGVRLESNAQLGMTLYAYLWTKGGKAAAEFNSQCIREFSQHNVMKGADDATRYWANGVLLLARVRLDQFMTDDGNLETERFFKHVVEEIKKCPADAVARILEIRR